MNVLCFDISSGGLSAAIFNEELAASHLIETAWQIPVEEDGSAVLDVKTFEAAFSNSCRGTVRPVHIDAISFSAFMHNFLLLDASDRPLTPIFTWLDSRGSDGVDRIRSQFGSSFHERTGCRYHPMFPVFKLASLRVPGAQRVGTAKSFAIAMLTGHWVEDHGTASATGLYNIRGAIWDRDIMNAVKLSPSALPPLVERDDVAGYLTPEAASRFGIPAGTPVIAGSGDGFLASLGSGCENPSRLAATLGTSSSARRVLPHPVLVEARGTFCYRINNELFLLGCASSNGGNVLDWARSIFGPLPEQSTARTDLPTFIPLLNGERSPDWNPALTATWHGINARHTAADLAYSVIDGVVFNLAHYIDILDRASGVRPNEVVLSGNGFLNRAALETLAAVLDGKVLRPPNQGLASLRGAAVCGLKTFGVNTAAEVERLVNESDVVPAINTAQARERYSRYRMLREKTS
ncbi:MAG: hypothetical protein DMG13_27640 [Acidobacteria bacterium]|nr:MAG: hypothetical protein DMG13_27640 [Acidobacteriota bacterium]